jgi:hypothetical protein
MKQSVSGLAVSLDASQAGLWAQRAIEAQTVDGCQAIGIASANRYPIDARTANHLATTLASTADSAVDSRMLRLHLDVFPSASLERLDTQTKCIPATVRSPLGRWQEVTVPVPVGIAASWSLIQLPKWIAQWRKQYGLLLIELGRMDLSPARIIGRLCQATYVVAGPLPTGSPDWVATHIQWMRSAGVNVAGSIVAGSIVGEKTSIAA